MVALHERVAHLHERAHPRFEQDLSPREQLVRAHYGGSGGAIERACVNSMVGLEDLPDLAQVEVEQGLQALDLPNAPYVGLLEGPEDAPTRAAKQALLLVVPQGPLGDTGARGSFPDEQCVAGRAEPCTASDHDLGQNRVARSNRTRSDFGPPGRRSDPGSAASTSIFVMCGSSVRSATSASSRASGAPTQ